MANRENYPASLFPLRGDIGAEAGDTVVVVQGIQTIPVTSTPPTTGGQVLAWNSSLNELDWALGNAAVQINGVGVSTDLVFLLNTAFTINYSTDDQLGVRINGV
jgi:hypothetical protein